jgi:hypothetical protein
LKSGDNKCLLLQAWQEEMARDPTLSFNTRIATAMQAIKAYSDSETRRLK